jgi:very-short-patch-repair endonuclease
MDSVSAIVRSLGGMAQKQQLVARGVRGFHLTAAVRSREVVRVRNGWYSTLDEQDPRLRAVRVGGRLTGISALAMRGAWILGKHPLHVSLHENAARMRTQDNRHQRLNVRAPHGVALHWDEPSVRLAGSATEVGLVDALLRVIMDEDFEVAVAVLDWAIHSGSIDRQDFEELVVRLPRERRGIAGWVDPQCESLPESLARTRLRLAGHLVVSQVQLGDLQRIDLVIDGHIGLEVDGKQFHSDRFESDRSKDVDITLQHLHALRPSASAIFYRWDRVAAAIDTALADRGVSLQNSGDRRRDPFSARGLTGWKRSANIDLLNFANREALGSETGSVRWDERE